MLKYNNQYKVLLVKTYFPSVNLQITFPLGIMYLASYLRNNLKGTDLDVRIIDMRLGKIRLKELEKYIMNYQPSIIGLSSLSFEAQATHSVANMIKNINQEMKVIVGGPYGTVLYRDILKDKNIDAVVIGEGEETFYELVNCYINGKDLSTVGGISYRRGDFQKTNPARSYISNLDQIPFPAWDLIDIRRYSKAPQWNVIMAGKLYMPIFTSRGCPYHCTYCHKTFGDRVRMRSPENVVDEIRMLSERCGVDEVHIIDDIFNLSEDRAKKICDLIIKNKLKIKIAFPNGIRGDIISKDLIKKLKQAGTYMIVYAVETASPRLQKMIKKNLDLNKVREAINFSDREGIIVAGFFMIGFPTESLEEIQETINFSLNSKLLKASFFAVVPYFGTELYKMAVEKFPEVKQKFSDPSYWPDTPWSDTSFYALATGIDLRKIQINAYRRFYFKIPRLAKLFWKIPRRMYFIKQVVLTSSQVAYRKKF